MKKQFTEATYDGAAGRNGELADSEEEYANPWGKFKRVEFPTID